MGSFARRIAAALLASLVGQVCVASAWADGEPAAVLRAREAFVQGAALAREMRWGDALQKFELSSQQHPHAGTTFNIGVCHRSLGQYTRARKAFLRALREHEEGGGAVLAESILADIHTLLAEVDRAVGSLDVSLEPASAAVLVDGRPLEEAGTQDGMPLLIAGTLPAGPARPPPLARFRIVLDPGTHVLVLSRKGFADIVHRESVRSGERTSTTLALERLPGILQIEATEPRSAISVEGLDMGLAPTSLTRPPGRYHVVVRKKGFVTYETHADLQPGEKTKLRAVMRPEEVSLASRWWFWTSVGVVVVGTAVGTWYATRPEPEKPALSGGGLGWTVRVP